MMKAKLETEVSKYMSYVLRHAPESSGLTLDSEGWVAFDELEKALSSKYDVSRAEIIEIVETIQGSASRSPIIEFAQTKVIVSTSISH